MTSAGELVRAQWLQLNADLRPSMRARGLTATQRLWMDAITDMRGLAVCDENSLTHEENSLDSISLVPCAPLRLPICY